ncbi:MAG: S49 family peptidase [Rickettsiales bacterium]|nr:S49 family peptidase [Rickettsiales bacterium]
MRKIFKLKKKPVIAIIRLNGVIGKVSNFSSGLTLESIAFADKVKKMSNIEAIVLLINSPGGSPVQSELISKKLTSLAVDNKGKKIPILSFCEDVAASGGYWLALTGDEIFASNSSIIGSIGVISSGFGFQDAIKKLGIERRIHSQGKNKSVLDPFTKTKAEDVQLINTIQKDIHGSFIDFVKTRRKDKITVEDDEVFNGKFWSGREAVKLGLIDNIGFYEEVLKKRYGENVVFKNIEGSKGFFRKKFAANLQISAITALANDFMNEITVWSRYKL